STTSVLQVTLPITGSYRIVETATADPFPNNSQTLSINGNLPYVAGMIITVNEDPYLIAAATYDVSTNKTIVMTSGPAKFNYIIPRITRTIRPILQAGSAFNTQEQANLNYPFTLVVGGPQSKVLVNGPDYQASEGGAITLTSQLVSGDVLYALY